MTHCPPGRRCTVHDRARHLSGAHVDLRDLDYGNDGSGVIAVLVTVVAMLALYGALAWWWLS